MTHEQLHGQPARYHVYAGTLCMATLSGFRDEDEALAFARLMYPDVDVRLVAADLVLA